MTLRIELAAYGEPALETLRSLIEEAKGGDPFRPVTVVVERGTVGLGVRRDLAATSGGPGQRGIANVAFVTLAGLADALAGPVMAEGGRAPLTDAVLRAAVRGVLSGESGPLLGQTREHPSTVDALVATYREMRTVDEATLGRLENGSARAAEVVAVIRSVRRRTADWYDEVDVLAEAVSRLEGPDPITVEGSVVVHLPAALTVPEARLVRTLASVASCTVIIGVTGDAQADDLARHMVASLDPPDEPVWPGRSFMPLGDEVLSAPTADAELLLVLRDLMARCEQGARPERMAIVHAGTPQYVTLLHNTLQSAGIPFNGSGVRPLSATVAGRMLLGALELAEHDWRREEVAAWLATGPLTHRGRPIPAARWDVLSAEAGVTQGLDAWRVQITARAHTLRSEASEGRSEGEDDDAPWRLAREAEANCCDDLVDFLEEMSVVLGQCPEHWAAWVTWAKKLLHQLVGGPMAFEGWPVEERAAAGAVEEAIGRLADLGRLDRVISPVQAKAALVGELEVPAPQTTRFGSGVWVTSVSAAVGLSLDVLYVVGMNDGIFPGRPSDDVLIPDSEREEARPEGSIPLRGARAVTMRRDYLAALAAARTRILSFPRGNQRDGRDLRPSRWLLDALGPLAQQEKRLYSSELESLPGNSHYRVVASYIEAVGGAGTPMSLLDRDLRSLLRWTSTGHRAADHWLARAVPEFGRGVDFMDGSRRGFTRFNGNLGHAASTGQLVPPTLSATRLESFAVCPRRYFFESLLRVLARPESPLLLSVDRGERGRLVHRILERFVRPQIGRLAGDGPDDPFDLDHLLAIAEDEMAAFEADGLAGPRSVWKVEQAKIRRELRAMAARDLQWREALGAHTIGVEQRFGDGTSEPMAVGAGNRQPVLFRGTVDRIDVAADGTRIVTDYKTGKPDRYKGIEEDHFLGNKAVQLALYGRVVSEEGHAVTAEYWFVSEQGKFERHGFEFTVTDARQLEHIVRTYAGTMERGHFPANPGDDRQCGHCPYNAVCPSDRHAVWDRVKESAALSPYADLVVPKS